MILRPSLLLAILIFAFSAWGMAEDSAGKNAKSDYIATTTIDSDIPLDQLKIMVKPLTKAELDVEAKAWFELLRNKAKQIAAIRLGVKKTDEAIDSSNKLAAEDSVEVAKTLAENSKAEAQETEQDITQSAQEQLGVEEAMKRQPGEIGQDETANEKTSVAQGKSSNHKSEATDSPTELKDELLADVTKLQDERTALSDRLEIVLNSLESKGGISKNIAPMPRKFRGSS